MMMSTRIMSRLVSHAPSTTIALPLPPNKLTADGNALEYFVDFKRIKCKGGNGGDGACSFLRVWKNPTAGPDGGNGGNGAHVIFDADPGVKCLARINSTLLGRFGWHGRGENQAGKSSPPFFINVPVNTQFKRVDTGETWQLTIPRQKFLGARGGAGGHGNAYYVHSRNTTPMMAEKGALGEEIFYEIQMTYLANVGLVGFPNAGKSSFLRSVSRARPKVASYPFTTLKPIVGMVEFEDFAQLAIADIPGIIEGSHRNLGLGLDFLQHMERCSCLLFVLDLTLSDPIMQLQELVDEIRQFNPSVMQRPMAIAGNKVDLDSGEQVQRLMELQSESVRVFPISTRTRQGLDDLLIHLRHLHEIHHSQLIPVMHEDPRLIRPDAKLFKS